MISRGTLRRSKTMMCGGSRWGGVMPTGDGVLASAIYIYRLGPIPIQIVGLEVGGGDNTG